MITRRGILGAGALVPVLAGRSRAVANYKNLNPVQVTSALDNTGGNVGNFTAAFPSTILPNVSVYEIYHMTVTGGTLLDTARILTANRTFSYVTLDINGGNEWDPSAPLLMMKDWDLFFYWAAGVNSPSIVTVWTRFDPSLPENALYGSFGGAP